MSIRSCARIGLVASIVVGALGCFATPHTFKGSTYEHPRYAYRVYAGEGGFVGADWQIDNYRPEGEGYREKVDGIYRTRVSIDTNDDGHFDWSEKMPTWDLRFRHLVTDARIGIQTIPLSTHSRSLQLDVLAERYLEAMSGDHFVYRFEPRSISVSERAYAPRVAYQGAVSVSGRPAWEVVFDRVNLERAEVDPNHAPRRERVVFVRTGIFLAEPHDATIVVIPTVMVFSLSASSETFAAASEDFADLVSRVRFYDSYRPASRAAVLACTDQPLVGFARVGRDIVTPYLDAAQAECVRRALPPELRAGSYSYGEVYQAPAPGVPPPPTELSR